MTFNTPKTNIEAIRQGDPRFMLTDGMVVYPRAMIHVLPECPTNIRNMLNWAIAEGYIKTVAHVRGKDLTWEALTK